MLTVETGQLLEVAHRRTRAIHRSVLEILLERILRLMQSLVPVEVFRRHQWELRCRQVQTRLDFLAEPNSFPGNKHVVLASLRTWILEQPDLQDEALSIESESLQETVSYPSAEPEEEVEDVEEEATGLGLNLILC